MKKTFVCLANSQKWGQRCVAGVELTDFDGNSYSIVQYNSQPKWLRPVSKTTHGEVPTRVVNRIQLLDIVELEMVSEYPQGYQSENILFDERSIKVIGQVEQSSEEVARFQHTGLTNLFGNQDRAIHVHAIGHITNSLVLIKPTSVKFDWVTYPDGNSQLRATFLFGGVRYNLPITDLNFRARYYKNPKETIRHSDWYFTVSLGVKYSDNFHYKLIAAVLGF
jgi:hypothetical protein